MIYQAKAKAAQAVSQQALTSQLESQAALAVGQPATKASTPTIEQFTPLLDKFKAPSPQPQNPQQQPFQQQQLQPFQQQQTFENGIYSEYSVATTGSGGSV